MTSTDPLDRLRTLGKRRKTLKAEREKVDLELAEAIIAAREAGVTFAKITKAAEIGETAHAAQMLLERYRHAKAAEGRRVEIENDGLLTKADAARHFGVTTITFDTHLGVPGSEKYPGVPTSEIARRVTRVDPGTGEHPFKTARYRIADAD